MTFYEAKLRNLKQAIYKNQGQVDSAIATRNYIIGNYQTDLNLDHLSESQSISKYHLIRLFKKYYGLTPRQYLINTRIEKSKELLRTGMTVTQVCFSVGFKSLGSFSTLFKQKTGKSPGVFKKEQLSRSTEINLS